MEHIDSISRIEKDTFPGGLWTRDVLVKSMSHGHIHSYVIMLDDDVIGYVIFKCMQSEAKILNLAVKNEYRRKGYGAKLLNFVLEKLSLEKNIRITLEVRESNKIALAMYNKYGFKFKDIIPKYYPDEEDAVLLSLNL